MIPLHLRFTIRDLLWLAVVVLLAGPPSRGAEPNTANDLTTAWRDREKSIRSLSIEWDEVDTVDRHVPPGAVTKCRFLLSGNRALYYEERVIGGTREIRPFSRWPNPRMVELACRQTAPTKTHTRLAALTMAEVYVSTDIEADGPIPGPNSMLSFASAAYLADKTLVGTFEANLETLPDAVGDPKTMEWWKSQPDAWAACRANLQSPADAMPRYVRWVKALPGKPVFVAYPAAYDFMFVYWYMIRFAGESPFSHSALDIKTFAMALLGNEYRDSVKRNMPRRWFDDVPHTHVALDDAKGQGLLFCNMLAEQRRQMEPGNGRSR